MINKLREKKGSIFPLTIAIVLSLFIIFGGVSEYLRLKLIVSGIKEAIQSAVISLSIENYDNIYSSSREGYSGGYKYIDEKDRWEEMLHTEDVFNKLDELLDLRIEEDHHVKVVNGEYEYKLSDLEVNIINTPFAPNSHGDVFEADYYIALEVPLSFGWEHLPPLKIRLKVKSEYMAKF